MNDLMGFEERKVKEDAKQLVIEMKEQDTQSVFEIRKLFRFDKHFTDYAKKDITMTRPVSAYTTGLIDNISDKFTKIVSSVN